MPSIKTLCRNVVAPLMEAYGFLRCSIGNGRFLESYYRQINDVLQVLTFLKRGKSYSFAFNIYPLSLGITDLDVDDCDIAWYRGEWSEWIKKNRPWECWNYRTAQRQWWAEEELIDTNFDEPVQLIRQYVIPLFEKGCNAKTAYEQITEYERTVFTHIIMHNSSYALLCLQAEDYENSERHMAAICKMCRQDVYEECNQKLKMIQNRDTESLHRFLEEGTKKTLDFLESIKPKRRSKK